MATSSNKYQAKYVYWNTEKQVVMHPIDVEIYRCHGRLKLPKRIVRFDSQHEFKVYLELAKMYGTENVSRQYPIQIIKPCRCYPNGKDWKVDFAICSTNSPNYYDYLVEAKGVVTSEFINTLVLLEQNNHIAFESLEIVFPRSIPTDNKVIRNLLKYWSVGFIITLDELKQLKTLP